MSDKEFDDYFKVLDKAADRLRTVIYVFIVVFVAMLLYGVSAFVYPSSQLAYDDMNRKARCIYADFPAECDEVRKDIDLHRITPQMKSEIDTDLWEHQLNKIYDSSVKSRAFSFPIFGLETDRDLLWLLFPLVGIIGYYIVLLTLGSTLRLFDFLMSQNKGSAFRLRMIQSTLVITVPLKTADMNSHQFGDLDPVVKSLWRVLAVGVFLIPILVSLFIMVDQSNVIAWLRGVAGETVFRGLSLWFGIQLVLEIALIGIEGLLFRDLIASGTLFGSCQRDVAALIDEVERTQSMKTAMAAE